LKLSNQYNKNILTPQYKNYLLIFEVPDKYMTSDMFLVYNNKGINTKIKLKPTKISDKQIVSTSKINDILSLKGTLEGISFDIENYDIKNEFLINYKYCIEKDCVLSKEYIKPTINENFDKVILKLQINFANNSKLDLINFYSFFSKFGTIQYKKGNLWFSQNSNFEELKSTKTNNENNIYIGINKEIIESESIKLVFNVRNSKYEYILK